MTNSTKILDGKWLSKLVQAEVQEQVSRAKFAGQRAPGLGVILVGDNPASHTYVTNKERLARDCGLETFDRFFPPEAGSEEVKAAIQEFNQDPRIDGILLQLPLPKHLSANELIAAVNPAKDADGLHPVNQGLLMRGEGWLRPCTPLGVMKLIDLAFSSVGIGAEGAALKDIKAVDLAGRKAVVIGRSLLVGKPSALMLLERNATVTIAHSRTRNLQLVTREADIVVTAVGIARFIGAEWIKDGAVVIDVGINRDSSGRLVGDVDFESVRPQCLAITPVPGGVGPMTVSMLVYNTVQAYLRNL